MALVVQLRVVDHGDHLTIHDVDESKETTTIGQDPASDVVLEGPGVSPVQVVLDYRQQPYHLAVPSEAEPVTVNGKAVPPGDGCEIGDRDVIEVAGYTITFRAYGEAPPAPPVPPPPPPEEPPPPPIPDKEQIPPDEDAGPPILTSLPEREQAWTIDAGQPITLQLRVANAGDLVAHFQVTADGVPPEWVTIEPSELHLNERSEATVAVSVTPPRLPTSKAGTYHLTLEATSPDNYPNERSQASADITIKPFYELAPGNLSPRRQSIPWSQPAGQAEVPLTNKGNCVTFVGLYGEDDARACRFEFQAPSDTEQPLYLARQANLPLPIEETVRAPVKLVPQNRPLIGRGGRLIDLHPRVHSYTITVTMAQGQQGPWMLSGEWENQPFLSRRGLLAATVAMILLLLACTYWIFRPRIDTADYARPDSIRAGQVVELDWEARPRFLIGFTLDGKPVDPPVVVRPERTTTYELRADTWLSHLFPAWAASARDTVIVRPVKPDILLFEARPERVLPGQRVVLSWVVDDAEELVLVDHGAGTQETLTSRCGSREVEVGQGFAQYTLRAIAGDGAAIERVVSVQAGSPAISVLSVAPRAITSTTNVTITWGVLGTDVVALDRRSAGPGGTFTVTPIDIEGARGSVFKPVSSSTVFTLTAGSGATQAVETARVKVLKPTPIPGYARTLAPTHAPTATPTHAPTRAPGLIIVYTALSERELKALGTTPTVSLTEILDRVGSTDLTLSARELGEIRQTPPVTLTKILDSFSRTDLTLEKLREFDYVHVVTPTDALATNILIVRKSTEDLIRQLLAEKEDPRADVVWMVATTGMIRLRAEGLLEPLAGIYEPAGMEKVRADWRDATMPPQWLGLTGWMSAFCVNEGKLPKENGRPLIPRSWQDLTDARYRGMVVMSSPYTSGTGYMALSGLLQMSPYGEADGWAYMDRLHENVAAYTSSGAEPCRLVAGDGNPGMAIGIAANICPSGGEPAGLTTVYPEEGAGWEMDAVALVRKDRIGEDALDFMAWAISKEAMERYAQFRAALSYTGPEPIRGCAGGFDEARMIASRFLWAAANYERITERWLSRYGGEPGP